MNTRIPWFKRLTLLALSVQLSACLNTSPTTTDQTESVNGTAAAVTGIQGCGATASENFESYIAPGWQQASPRLQKIMIASDPQPFRAMINRNPYQEEVNETRWKRLFSESWTGLFRLQRQGDYHVPLLVNGDMTDYGHGGERKAMREAMKKMGFKDGPLMLPGLGNHDYDQNVEKCSNNGCARDAVCDHIEWVTAIKNKSSGVNFDYQWLSSSNTHRGSLAYSVDVGKIHIVQLNTEPTYHVKFETGGFPNGNPKTRFDITSSMDWLERDLRDASARGQYTIINMHRWSWMDPGLPRFTKLAEDNKVVAVFLGHVHRQLGYVWKIGKIPVFQDGALLARSFLNVLFYWDTKVMQVNAFADFNDVGEWKYNMDTLGDPPPPPPPPPEKLSTITLYPRKNFQGEPCTFTMESYDEKFLTMLCPGIVWGLTLNPSIKVKNYTGSLVALEGISAARFVENNYSGDFELPDLDLDDNKQLPSPLRLYGRGIGGFNIIYTRPWNK